jgi:beta-glucosidase
MTVANDAAGRAKELLDQMTLREKIGQVNQIFCGWNAYHLEEGRLVLEPAFEAALSAGEVGAVYGMHRSHAVESGVRRSLTPEEGARAIAEIQELAKSRPRLGIPLLVSEESPKGYHAPGATTFPSPIAYGSSWNPSLLRALGRVAGTEIRAGGGHVGYAPVLDICHDPRWSRIEEIFGEDPYLVGELGAAMVEGMQGADIGRPDAVVSTLKHFVAYGTTEGGRNTAPAHLGPRELREMYLPPFERAVKAGALSVMCSYNEIDGIPVASDGVLLTDVLRGEWGFQGFVVSDALAIDELALGNAENRKHRTAASLAEAAAQSLRAGVDVSLWDQAYLHLATALEQGFLEMADLDRAVLRLLTIKFRLGLFDRNDYVPGRAASLVGCPEHRAISLVASRQGLVLLKNERGILPFRDVRRIAVIGPNADNLANQIGTYTPSARDISYGTTVLEGIRARAGDAVEVRSALGCRIKAPSRAGFDEALACAAWSDVVVAVFGGSSNQSGGVVINAAGQADPLSAVGDSDIDCGENIDRADLALSGVQPELLALLAATGKPLVLVLVQGRPHTLGALWEKIPAALCAWYPGPFGGQAIAEVLFGDVNPSGKLTLSFPHSVGQIPVHYNHKASAEKRYLGCDTRPVFPFGHGLSYSRFEYNDLSLSSASIRCGESLEVSVRVSNTGTLPGTEIVQLYLTDEQASVTRPVRSLRGFCRVDLAAGESRTVLFPLGYDDMALWDRKMQRVVEPGAFTVFVGGDSSASLSLGFHVRQ